MNYGPDLAETCRQVGIYTGQILKGGKPADTQNYRSRHAGGGPARWAGGMNHHGIIEGGEARDGGGRARASEWSARRQDQLHA